MRFILSVAVTALLATPLAAQAPSLAPVVVTATRAALPVAVPASVTVLSGDSLRARGISMAVDALRLVPGVQIVTSSSFGSQSSLFVRGGQSSYVRVLLDGVPLNEPGGAVDLAALSLDNIERIEVVRGPASVLYGQDAATGVVQLVSRQAAGRRAALQLDAGSYGTRDAALTAGVASSRASLSAMVSDRATDGILAFNNQSHTQTGSASARLLPDARTALSFAARWQAATYHYPTESDGSVGDRNAENTAHRLLLSAAGTRVLSDRLTAAWTLTSSEHDPRSNDGPDTPADTLGFYGFFSRGAVTRRAADLRLTARARDAQFVTVGAEVARDHERSSTRSLSKYGEDDGAFVAARQTRALYAEATGTVLRRGTYQLGARLDDNSAFGTFRTMRAGASWRVASSWRVRSSLGTAFRAPSFFENFATGYVRGNAQLAPERTRGLEVGVDGRVGGVALTAVVYRQRFDNLIQYTSKTASASAPNYYNVARAAADGAEADASFALPAQWRGRLTYAYSRTRVLDSGFDTGSGATFVLGQPLMRRPAHTARAELGRRVAQRGEVILGAAYTGVAHDRDYRDWPAADVRLPARTLVDASVSTRLTAERAIAPVTLRFRGDNLSNVAYDGIFGFRAPGRTLRLGLTIGQP